MNTDRVDQLTGEDRPVVTGSSDPGDPPSALETPADRMDDGGTPLRCPDASRTDHSPRQPVHGHRPAAPSPSASPLAVPSSERLIAGYE